MISKSSKLEHSIMVSKIMILLAKYLHQNMQEWELTGLLHDLDYDLTKDVAGQHGTKAAMMLGNKVSRAVSHAIIAHDPGNGCEAETALDKGLILADCLAWLIDDQGLLELDQDLRSAIEKEAVIKPKIVQNIELFSNMLDLSFEKIIRELKINYFKGSGEI
jgi:putative nucleotidyltransferase with HDIG domain